LTKHHLMMLLILPVKFWQNVENNSKKLSYLIKIHYIHHLRIKIVMMKILLADDHFLVLDGLEVLLSTFEFVDKTESVLNYIELKEILKEESFDILLLDIHFGKHDGRKIIGEIKQIAPEMKIIALTSHADSVTIKSSINAGFDGYLLKIDSREEIEKALKVVTNDG